MAIDFSQVKTITIPEGSVTKITDSNGNILWQSGGQSEGWHTIWEGSKTCSATKSGTNDPVISGEAQNFAQTVAGTGYTPKIRITFSYSNTNTDYANWKNKFMLNGTSTTTSLSSPVIIAAVKDHNFFSTYICGVFCYSNDDETHLGVGLNSSRNKTNNNRNISLTGRKITNINSYDGNFTLTFTVTKIEQYY